MRPAFVLLALLLPACASADGFVLESATFAPGATLAGAQVYGSDGCSGANVSPELHWRGAPAGTQSFAVTVFDPDAPTGHGWWHWLLYDIPAQTNALAAGAAMPAGSVQAANDFGERGYAGPCPPPGDAPHHYVFTVYALRLAHLGLAANTPPARIREALEADALAKATLTARYGR